MKRLLMLLLTLAVSLPIFAMKGVVYTSNGEPLANARIEVFRSERIQDLVARLATGGPATPVANAATDENGVFALETKSDSTVRLVVTAPGFAPHSLLHTVADEEIAVALTPVEQKSGRITASGAPVAGATVSAISQSGQLLASTRTDERGSYAMPDPNGWAMGLCVVHSDFAPLCRWNYDGRPQSQSLDLKLEKGASASGKVIGGDGKPIANATIFASEWPIGTTRDDGSFAVHRIPAEVKVLRAVIGNQTGLAPRSATNVTIALAAGRSITGAFVDPKGRALSGTVVHARSAGRGGDVAMHRWVTAVVDAKGHYRLENLAADEYGLYAEAPVEWDVDGAEVDLRKTSTLKHDFRATAAEEIRGIVRDEKGQPVIGALVSFVPKEMPIWYVTAHPYFENVPTGPTGRFRLRSFSEDHSGRIVAFKRGYAAGVTPEKSFADAKSRSITVTLPKGIEVKGSVVDAEGKTIAGAAIIAMTGDATLGAAPGGAMLAATSVNPWVRSDDGGNFTINLNPGIHDLSVWKQGYAAKDIGNIEVSASTAPVRVVLRGGVDIRGRVVRAGGAAVADGYVYAFDASQRGGANGKVESDGTFTIDSLEPGTYTLRYQSEDGSDASKVVNAPASNVTLELPVLFEIRGRVTQKAKGAPVEQFSVSLSTEMGHHGPRAEEVVDAEGKFVRKVPAGPVEVTVSSPGFMPVTQAVTAGPSSDQTYDFTLSKGRKIRGRITGPDGKAIADVRVGSGTEEDDDNQTSGDEEGEYEIDGVNTDATTLVFTKEGFIRARRPLAAGTSDEQIDVVLDPGRKITGRVVDGKGNAVGEAWIYASSEAHNAETQSVQSGADGSFTIAGLTNARYSFSVNKDGFGEAEQDDVDITTVKSLLFTLGSKESGTIRGTVAGVADGSWLMGMIRATGENGSAQAQVGRDGKFVIENVPAGEVQVVGILMAQQKQSSTKAVKVHLQSGGDVEVDLALGGDASLRGNVTTDGQPLAAANIMLSQSNGGGYWRSTTAADGSYEFAGVENGHYAISVTHLGGIQYSTELEVNGPSTFDVRVEFSKIEGRVTDDEGNAIAGARIAVASIEKNARESNATAVTDATGAFTVKANAALEYRVTATSKGFANAFATTDGHTPVNLQLTRSDGVRLRLVDTRNGATLTGYVVVTDETGKTQFPVATEKQQDGSLLLPLPAGTYRISASASEYASGTITVQVPSKDQSIGLTPGGTLVINSGEDATELIKLVKPTGQEYVRCYCNGIAEIRLSGATTKVDHVAAGAYRMDIIDRHGVVKRSLPVTIAEGQTTTIDARKQ